MFRHKKVISLLPTASLARIALALRSRALAPATTPCPQQTVPADDLFAEDANLAVNGRVEKSRKALSELIHQWQAAPAQDRDGLLIHIRARQDALGTLRQRNLSLFAHASKLAWVESWNPDVH